MPPWKIPPRRDQLDQCRPPAQLNIMNDDFEYKKLLGRGVYGEVWEVVDKVTNRVLALKKLPKAKAHDVANEITILCQLHQHCQPYILCYEGYFEDKSHIYILTESLSLYEPLSTLIPHPGQGLGHPSHSPPSMDLIINLVEGLITLHLQNIVHRDIKPANILFNQIQIKYIDFGFSCSNRCNQLVVGTPNYMAPELYQTLSTTKKEIPIQTFKLFDIWALGATIYELLTGKPPIETVDYLELSGLTDDEINVRYRGNEVAAELMVFKHYYSFPSTTEPMKTSDDIIVQFDKELRSYSQKTIGRQISIVNMLQANPAKRSLYA